MREPLKFKISGQGAWHQEVHDFGLNYRLPDVLCALGLSQLNRLAEFKKKRNDIFQTYSDAFGGIDAVSLPSKREYVDPTWHLFPIRVPVKSRKSLFSELRSKGIGVQVNYFPAHLHPVFQEKGFKVGQFPISEAFYDSEISLPMHCELSDRDLGRIVKTLTGLL